MITALFLCVSRSAEEASVEIEKKVESSESKPGSESVFAAEADSDSGLREMEIKADMAEEMPMLYEDDDTVFGKSVGRAAGASASPTQSGLKAGFSDDNRQLSDKSF